MKCSIIDRPTICFDHLATPLHQHTLDQSLYATLIQVGPGPLQNALEFLYRGIVLHLLVGFPLDVIPEVLDGVAVGGSCRPFHTLNAIFLQKLIGDSSTVRSCIVVHKDKLVSDGCCIRHDCNPIENLWDNIKRKANKKVKDDTSLEEFQRILQRAWANLDQRRI